MELELRAKGHRDCEGLTNGILTHTFNGGTLMQFNVKTEMRDVTPRKAHFLLKCTRDVKKGVSDGSLV